MNKPHCGVLAAGTVVQNDLGRLALSTRRLRRVLRKCARCPEKNCPLRQELSSAISKALLELTEEWNL